MIRNKSRMMLAGLSVLLVMMMALMGCSNNNSSNEQSNAGNNKEGTDQTAKPAPTETQKPLDPVTLKIMIPGDKPANWDEVKAAAEEKMASTINVKLDVSFVSWSDIDQKERVAMAGGEAWDLMWDAPGWPHYEEFVSSGYYAPIDELLEQYGSDIMKTRPQELFDASRINGKLYGVPLATGFSQDPSVFIYEIRKDIREKLGIAPIQSWDELMSFMKKAHEAYPDIPTFVPQSYDQYPLKTAFMLNPDKHLRYFYQAIYTEGTGKDMKFKNIFDDPNPIILDAIKERRQLVLDGIIPKDTLTLGNAEFAKGKAVVTNASQFGVPLKDQTQLASAVPGAETEAFSLFNADMKALTGFVTHNYISVPVTSKNKERAIMFLNWANASQENYDLLAYGIKGKNWEEKGDGLYEPSADSVYPVFGYDWIWNPTQDRVNAAQSEDALALDKWNRDASNFTYDKSLQFLPNKKAVQNEITALDAMGKQYWGPIVSGVLDTDKGLAEYKGKAYEMLKKVQEEYQQQFDAFMASGN